MGFINLAEKTINAKLVYYGVGLGGKTTSLKVVHQMLCPRDEVKLVSINTEEDSTLLFDFLPIDLGQVEGFKIRVQGFTVPGQQKYVVMRKYVLQSADAVVLVIDSRRTLIKDNLRSIKDLKINLQANGLNWRTIPLVIQYNKRDLSGIVETDELDKLFRFRKVPTFETVATEGQGVFEAFTEVVGWMVEDKIRQYGLGKGTVDPVSVAEEAQARLSRFRIQQTELAAGPGAGLVSVAVPEEAEAPIEALDRIAPRKPAPASDTRREGAARHEEVDTATDVATEDLPDTETEPDPTEEPHEADIPEQAVGLLGQAITSNLELAELYAELASYKSLLEKKNRELVEVNQLISHDLKKPLTVFKTVVSLMQKGHLGELNSRQSDAISNCSESIRYMEDLISDILESSRLDYDGREFVFEDVNMTLLVGGIVSRLRYHLEDSDVRVDVEPLPVVLGDENALQSVFMNLIGNAINYRDPNKDQCRIFVSAEQEQDAWCFRVADNGIGIPSDSLESIWQKFSRGTNTAGVSGTGLGLYIVQQIVRGHGGEISVESELEGGTTFVIRLPRSPVQPQHSPVA